MTSLRRIITWPKRRWRAGGFGIHSPFAFNFVTQVLAKRVADGNEAELRSIAGDKYRRYAPVYRCVKHFKPQTVVIYPAGDEILTRIVQLANSSTAIQADDEGSTPDMTIATSTSVVERDNGSAVFLISRIDKEPTTGIVERLTADCEHGMDFSDYRTWIMCRFNHLPRQSFKIVLK